MKETFIIKEDFINSRVDRWFKRNICNVPQSLIEKSLRKGKIKVNNKKRKSSYKLKKDDLIFINDLNFIQSKNKSLKFKYKATKKEINNSSNMFIEDNENYVVINKPPGIAVQSGTKSSRNIIDILRGTREFNNFSPFTVHRIDKETSGILIVAKNRKYAQLFTSLFRIRKIHKTYLGIVLGEMSKKKGTFTDLLFNYEGDKKIKSKAITHYTVINSNNNYTLLKLNPETGRKHQLRKQLLMHGHPILGDSKYRVSENRPSKKESLMLHAHKIKFSIAGTKFNYLAEPPLLFKNMLKEKYLKNF
jgi:23S rRNA pseudouridine955/2504/2580 synthase